MDIVVTVIKMAKRIKCTTMVVEPAPALMSDDGQEYRFVVDNASSLVNKFIVTTGKLKHLFAQERFIVLPSVVTYACFKTMRFIIKRNNWVVGILPCAIAT